VRGSRYSPSGGWSAQLSGSVGPPGSLCKLAACRCNDALSHLANVVEEKCLLAKFAGKSARAGFLTTSCSNCYFRH
jgi:hypothetical protein